MRGERVGVRGEGVGGGGIRAGWGKIWGGGGGGEWRNGMEIGLRRKANGGRGEEGRKG